MATYRVAVIGTGGIARYHADYYRNDPRTEIVAGADIHAGRLGEFCDQYGVPAGYADYRELLEQERPDIVSVCTWTASHPEIGLAAVEAGVKGLLYEKPMGAEAAGPRAVVEACAQQGVTLVVHHQTRFSPPFVAARQAIAAGLIGEPLVATCSCQAGLLNIGSHTIDIGLYMLGDPTPEWALGQAQRTTNRYERGVLSEDLCAAIIGLDGGARIAFDCDLPDMTQKQDRGVIGTDGMLRVDAERAGLLSAGSGGWQTLPMEPQPTYLDEFLAELEGGPESRCAGRLCLAAHECLMGLYESARVRQLVRLPVENPGSGLQQMVTDGVLPAVGEAYDTRSQDALDYAFGRF